MNHSFGLLDYELDYAAVNRTCRGVCHGVALLEALRLSKGASSNGRRQKPFTDY